MLPSQPAIPTLAPKTIGAPGIFLVPLGKPTSRNFADLAARRIISADPKAPPHRQAHIARFIDFVSQTIEPFFRDPAKSQASDVARAVKECFLRSEWRGMTEDAGRMLEVQFQIEAVFREAQEAFFRDSHSNIF